MLNFLQNLQRNIKYFSQYKLIKIIYLYYETDLLHSIASWVFFESLHSFAVDRYIVKSFINFLNCLRMFMINFIKHCFVSHN